MSQTLYRMYDSSGSLLYVGISSNPGRRLQRHASTKDWWEQIDRIIVEHFDTREAVLDAERRAIIDERPQHNIIHNRATQPAAPAPARRESSFAPPAAFTPGVVLALAVSGRATAPVGQVVDCTPTTLFLAPFNWGTGYFDHDNPMELHLAYVMTFRVAERMSPDQAVELGYAATDLVWDMDPLASFQDEYRTRALSAAETRQIKRILSNPDHYGPVLP